MLWKIKVLFTINCAEKKTVAIPEKILDNNI